MTIERAIIIEKLISILTGMFELLNTFGIYNGVFKLGILSIIVHELPFVVEKQSRAILFDNFRNIALSLY